MKRFLSVCLSVALLVIFFTISIALYMSMLLEIAKTMDKQRKHLCKLYHKHTKKFLIMA